MRSTNDKITSIRRTRSRNYKESLRLDRITVNRGHEVVTLIGHTFVLGGMYYLRWYNKKPHKCKFIQVTPCGYNFLDMDTSRCILKRHLYVPKKMREKFDGSEKFVYTLEGMNIISHNQAKQCVIDYYKSVGKIDDIDSEFVDIVNENFWDLV